MGGRKVIVFSWDDKERYKHSRARIAQAEPPTPPTFSLAGHAIQRHPRHLSAATFQRPLARAPFAAPPPNTR